MAKSESSMFVQFSKVDAAKQIVYGEVYIPMFPDTDGDFMTPDEIEAMAHDFMRRGLVDKIDTNHDLKENGSCVVESFIVRKGDPDFIEGSWVAGVHIPDKEVWGKVESGEINGFSMYGRSRKEQRILEIEIPDDGTLIGKTSDANDHWHMYRIRFSEKGDFLGGSTGPANNIEGEHDHDIHNGTITELAKDDSGKKHGHRYSFLEALT